MYLSVKVAIALPMHVFANNYW